MGAESRKAEVLRRKDTYADLMDEVRDYIGMSPEEKDRLIQQTVRLARQILLDRPDRDRVLDWVDPLPESSERILRRLREEYRRARAPR